MFPIKILILQGLIYIEIFQEEKNPQVLCLSVNWELHEKLTGTLSGLVKRQWVKHPTQHVPGTAGECFSLTSTPFQSLFFMVF